MARKKKRRGRARRPARVRRPVGTKRGGDRWAWWAAAGFAAAISAWVFFVARKPEEPSVGRSEAFAQGQALYAQHCASCHGADLEGQADWKRLRPDGRYPAPPHDETGHTWHHGDDYLFSVTKRGGQASAPPGFLSGMPGFEGTLSDDEIWSILRFIKSRWPREILDRQRHARSR